jgi:hypothetical protein
MSGFADNAKWQAKQRRIRLLAWVLAALPANEVAAHLASAMPPDVSDLVRYAKKKARNLLVCAHCGGSMLDVPEAPDPSFVTPKKGNFR